MMAHLPEILIAATPFLDARSLATLGGACKAAHAVAWRQQAWEAAVLLSDACITRAVDVTATLCGMVCPHWRCASARRACAAAGCTARLHPDGKGCNFVKALRVLPGAHQMCAVPSQAEACRQFHAGAPVVAHWGAIDAWPSCRAGPRRWTLANLATRFPSCRMKLAHRVGEAAGATEARLTSSWGGFAAYAASGAGAAHPHTPLYVFDSAFPADHGAADYDPSDLDAITGGEGSDLLALLPPPPLRPTHRWVICGGSGSGSPWHVDPFGTSAWNASLSGGNKHWLLLPPHVNPPGE